MKRAREMEEADLAAEEDRLKPIATRHSPICNCQICHRYTEVGLERLERKLVRLMDEADELAKAGAAPEEGRGLSGLLEDDTDFSDPWDHRGTSICDFSSLK